MIVKEKSIYGNEVLMKIYFVLFKSKISKMFLKMHAIDISNSYFRIKLLLLVQMFNC